MSQQVVNKTTDVGRLVAGSLFKPSTKDAEGNALVVKNGPNAGQPRQEWYFAVAIEKKPGQHWASSEWGSAIWNVGHAAFPQAAQGSRFAWKITDGDSTEANMKGKRPCDREGYPGHWILHFSSGFPLNLYKARPGVANVWDSFNDENAFALGHYVQVNFNVQGNGSQQQPGIYLNPKSVCWAGFGQPISIGVDPSQAGFGQAPLPAGASLTPPAGYNPAPAAAPAAPGHAAPPPPAAGAVAPPPVPGAAPGHVAPPPPAAVAPQPAPAPAPQPTVSYAVAPNLQGQGHTVESLTAQAGNVAQALANGWLVQVQVAAPLPPAISAPVAAPAPAPTAPVGLTPNPGFVAIPGQAAPPPPAAVAPQPAPQLAPAARRVVMNPGQAPQADFHRAGFTDDMIVNQGFGQWAA